MRPCIGNLLSGIAGLLEMSEDEMKYLDYFIEKSGDDLDKLGNKVANLGKKFAQLEKQAEVYKQGIKEVFGESFGADVLNMSGDELTQML